MLRVLVASVLLAACGSSAPKGPAWPAPYVSDDDEDGGEPLDPRPAARYAAAVERSADREPEKEKEKPAAEEPAAAASETSATSSEATPEPTETADDDLPITEEIVIEIDGE